jgi:hypothetical protein
MLLGQFLAVAALLTTQMMVRAALVVAAVANRLIAATRSRRIDIWMRL